MSEGTHGESRDTAAVGSVSDFGRAFSGVDGGESGGCTQQKCDGETGRTEDGGVGGSQGGGAESCSDG